MRWLACGKLDPAAAQALRRHGHVVVAPTDVGLMADAAPIDLLKGASERQLDIVTADPTLADAPFAQDFWFARSIVFLLVQGDVEQDDAIDRLFTRYKRLTPRRLYTVTAGRVKIRQLPGRV